MVPKPRVQHSRAFFLGLLTLLLAGLSACSPAFNWRVVPNEDLGYSATFPDKPVQVTRQLQLLQAQVPLTLQAAQAQDVYFAVGTVPLTGAWAGRGQELTAALAQALANNVRAPTPQLNSEEWLGLPGQRISLQGSLPDGRPAVVMARFFVHRDVLFEVVAMGPATALGAEVSTPWFTGFRLLGR